MHTLPGGRPSCPAAPPQPCPLRPLRIQRRRRKRWRAGAGVGAGVLRWRAAVGLACEAGGFWSASGAGRGVGRLPTGGCGAWGGWGGGIAAPRRGSAQRSGAA